MYLVCRLDEEHYAFPDFRKAITFGQAARIISEDIATNIPYYERIIINQAEENRWHVDYGYGNDDWNVYEVHQTKTAKEFIVVHHHAYQGVDFDIVGEYDSIEEARKIINREVEKVNVDGNIVTYLNQTVIDNGIEWEVWSIIERSKL